MRKICFVVVFVICTMMYGQQPRLVGGDLSLVPAYETVGDVWLDSDGNAINSYYSDGMITFLHDVAGWNAVRVRLLVDPSADKYLATCQDLDYVKQLGKRVKDAGMTFLLDIFYSDTWADVNQQWIPQSWGFNRTTATATLAAKVKSYTTEVINALAAYGAAPDYVQLGNEVSYGMLWDSATGASKTPNCFYLGNTYSSYKTQIDRFASLLKAGAEGVRASDCPDAKIVLHCERTASIDQTLNFYDWIEGDAGFTDYDVIGLSYYPQWHGNLTNLDDLLSSLENSFEDKEIQIVETGYYNREGGKPDYDTSDTWPYSPAGQAAFLKDLIAMLKEHPHVNGLYYWQPEECGNGAGEDEKNRVMDSWDNRGFWELTWKTGTHALQSNAALMTLKTFIADEEPTDVDMKDSFENLDFESCTYFEDGGYIGDCPGWDINFDRKWSDGPWPKVVDEWHSKLCDGYLIQAWNSTGNELHANYIIRQKAENLPAGIYTITATVHTDYDGMYLYANDQLAKVTPTSQWGTAYEMKVTTILSEPGTLELGLKFTEEVAATSEINLYADNFKVVRKDLPLAIKQQSLTASQTDAWYDLNGRKLNARPTAKGFYIHQGKVVGIP